MASDFDSNVVTVSPQTVTVTATSNNPATATIERHGTGEATVSAVAVDMNGNRVSKSIQVISPGNVTFAKGGGDGDFGNNTITLTAGTTNANSVTLNATVDPDNPKLILSWKKTGSGFNVTPMDNGRSARISASGTGGSGTIEITAPGLTTTTISVTVNATNSVLAGVNGGNSVIQKYPTAQKNTSTKKPSTTNDSKLNITKK